MNRLGMTIREVRPGIWNTHRQLIAEAQSGAKPPDKGPVKPASKKKPRKQTPLRPGTKPKPPKPSS
jgi:hypothetical protein